MNDFGNISNAKAIAIDLSKKTDGSDFILEETESVNVVLNMTAPSSVTTQKNRAPVAYNNIYVSSTVIDSFQTEQPFLIHHDYTSVIFKVKADVKLHKISSQSGKPIKGIKFRLWGTSDYGTEYDIISSTDKNGNITFKKLEKGQYILSEYQASSE